MKKDLKYYVTIFLRRLPLFLIVALGLSAAAVALAVSLPTVYSSNTTLLVESAQIPDELASSTVQTNASEQLEIIEQRLMTRANLIDVARALDVFEDVDAMTPDQIVRKMRSNTEFNSTSGKDRATLMQITFYGRSAKIASGVVNEYVTRILDENVRLRTDQAEDTLEFFRQEVDRLGNELGEYSAKIVAFQNENSEALPDSLDYRLTRQSTLQERQAQISRERMTLQDQRERLVQIYESTGQIQASQSGPLTAEERQLQRVREELAAASAVYSDVNPKVKVLKIQLEQLERVVAAQQGGEVPTDSETVLQINLAEIDTRMAALDDQADEISTELAKLQSSINKTPANAISLGALQRDYENIQLQYSAAQERLSKAATGERIELSSKGQRIAVLEQPTVPTEPTSPNRPLIAIGGTTLGLGAGLGLVLLLELLNGAIRRPVELTSALGITPLVTIPYIPTRAQTVRKRSLQFAVLAVLAAGIPALLYLLHTEYLPLDLLASRVTERLGI